MATFDEQQMSRLTLRFGAGATENAFVQTRTEALVSTFCVSGVVPRTFGLRDSDCVLRVCVKGVTGGSEFIIPPGGWF